ncbi:MAG: DUF2878 domain-containing protein [Planctomycetota bacterium]|nr:MAG: DUF2878 domain-containing protein [Planctomycetota bacterium]
MKKLCDFALFQCAWYAAVAAAASGRVWIGPLAVALLLLAHLAWLDMRASELARALLIGLAGGALDSALRAAGVLAYPAAAESWPQALAPPWVPALWAAFAALPRHSMAWLVPRPAAAALFGALGGPLSYWAGVRMGAVGIPHSAALTYAVLAAEYAIATPLVLRLASRRRS